MSYNLIWNINKSFIVDKNIRVGKIPLKDTIKSVVLLYLIFTIMTLKKHFLSVQFYFLCKNRNAFFSSAYLLMTVQTIINQQLCWKRYKLHQHHYIIIFTFITWLIGVQYFHFIIQSEKLDSQKLSISLWIPAVSPFS